MEKSTKWRRLDNTANIFPVISNKKVANIFRVACILKENVNKNTLEKAVNILAEKTEVYNVRLKKGFFWYYFEKNNSRIRVTKEEDYPCRYIDFEDRNEILYRVTYYKKRINLEISHMLTDGTGAMNFLRQIVKIYLDLMDKKKIAKDKLITKENIEYKIEDSYLKNYKDVKHKGYYTENAHKLISTYLPFGMLRIIHGNISVKELKKVTKEENCTITEYLNAILLWTIYKVSKDVGSSKKPIKVCVPVNLRTYFDSDTTLNFFSFIPTWIDQKDTSYTFKEVLQKVKEQFKEELSKEKMVEKISYNVSKEKKIFIRLIPLFVKKYGIKAVYIKSSKSYTATLSNLGVVKIEDEYKDKIEKFQFIFEPTLKDPLKLGVVSYGDNLVVSMSSILENPIIEREYFRFLASKGLRVEIEGNGAKNEKM